MITAISALETNVLKAMFLFAKKSKNINFPKDLFVENEIVKSNQLNIVLTNLKAKGIIDIKVDLFGFSMVSMTLDGVKFCKQISRKK